MSTSQPSTTLDSNQVADFKLHLSRSKRIVALLGAGLSASSGLPTFRGAGGLWRTHDATSIAAPEAFETNPAFVWQFYSYRRHMALNARPNKAHMALSALSRIKPDFITLSQNVDGLSPRAKHPGSQLKLLHGSLFDIKCWDEEGCGYKRVNDFVDPIVPALAIPPERERVERELQTGKYDTIDTSGTGQSNHAPQSSSTITTTNPLIKGADISDISIPLPDIPTSELPHCPDCKTNLLRPGVVWFGEPLPEKTLTEIDEFFNDPEPIDLMLVIGTSSNVYPAAGYTEQARYRGARICVVNMDPNIHTGRLSDKRTKYKRDWLFVGDAAEIIPELFKDEIGEVEVFKDE